MDDYFRSAADPHKVSTQANTSKHVLCKELVLCRLFVPCTPVRATTDIEDARSNRRLVGAGGDSQSRHVSFFSETHKKSNNKSVSVEAKRITRRSRSQPSPTAAQ